MSRASRAAIALAVIAAVLTTFPSASFAAKKQKSRVAAMGAGAAPSARASATGTAWIYTGNFRNTNPDQITGSIQLNATKGASISQDKFTVASQFTYQDSKYTVRVTCPYPISGQDFPGHGPVQFLRSVLGSTDMGTLDLPETQAHVAVYGRATISRDGKTIAENQPAAILVVDAIHGSDQAYLSTADTSSKEIMMIVPGPLNGQKFVQGFANGAFYVYWPSASLSTSGDIRPTPMPANIPTRSGRGPATPRIGTQAPIGTIQVSLTNTGIVKQMGTAESGLYEIQITNNSSRSRGFMMTGIDLCCTSYTRYSKILSPGASQTMQWYFAPGKVQFKDFYGGTKTREGYSQVKLGGHSTSIVFN